MSALQGCKAYGLGTQWKVPRKDTRKRTGAQDERFARM